MYTNETMIITSNIKRSPKMNGKIYVTSQNDAFNWSAIGKLLTNCRIGVRIVFPMKYMQVMMKVFVNNRIPPVKISPVVAML